MVRMNKALPIFAPDRSAQSGTESIIEWIESLEIVLPKLSPMALQSASFDFYDKSLSRVKPTAAALAAGIMALPELDQKTAAARRSEWSRSRCVEYLRSEAARLNVELVQIAEKTKSEAVKIAVIDAIYGAIVAAFPHLKAEAADMAVKRKLELAGRIPLACGDGPMAVRKKLELARRVPHICGDGPADAAADGEADMVQIINAQLAALRLVHRYLVPAAAAEGITIDALQANGLVQNLLIQSYYQRTHQKFSRTKIEAKS